MPTPVPSSDPTATKRLRVMVVDDDVEIGALLTRYLEGQGLSVRTADSGAQFRREMLVAEFDVVLLDLGLPDDDGLSLMRELRSRWQGPVIIVSGRGESVERVVGLELGADDYIAKPFDFRELLARIRSIWRRAQPPRVESAGEAFLFDELRLDPAARRLVGRDGQDIPLTSGEFALLHALVQRPLQVLTRDQLMNAIHGRDAGPYDRAIDVQIGRLRRKLESDAERPELIKAVRGAGYLFTASVRRG